MQIGQRIPGGPVFVDGSRIGEVGPMVISQRDGLAQSGFVTAVAPYDRHAGKTVGEPRIITQGFVYPSEAEGLLKKAGDLVRATASSKRGAAASHMEKKVEKALSNFFYKQTRRRPVVTVALLEV